MKKIDLRCRCCDNNPLRKSSESSEKSCPFFARGIILAQFFALHFLQISRQLAGRNSRLRLNDFRSLQSTNPSVPNCIQQFPFFLLRFPKVTSSSYQWMSFFYYG
jgi:hypothetical protein